MTTFIVRLPDSTNGEGNPQVVRKKLYRHLRKYEISTTCFLPKPNDNRKLTFIVQKVLVVVVRYYFTYMYQSLIVFYRNSNV